MKIPVNCRTDIEIPAREVERNATTVSRKGSPAVPAAATRSREIPGRSSGRGGDVALVETAFWWVCALLVAALVLLPLLGW